MSEMVERVARAMLKHARQQSPILQVTLSDEDLLTEFRELARAAIAAMREPTAGMIDAGESNCKSWWTRGRTAPPYGIEPGHIYGAMIDEALK